MTEFEQKVISLLSLNFGATMGVMGVAAVIGWYLI